MDNRQTAFSYLVDNGYSPAAAAGIVGNLVQESGVNPNVNPGDGGTAHGIAQWRGDRYTGLLDFAKTRGVSANDLNTQLDYLNNELKSKYGSTYNKIMSAQTPGDAAAAFALGFERPKGAETGIASNVDGWQNRLAAANAIVGFTPQPSTGGLLTSAPASTASMTPVAEAEASVPMGGLLSSGGGSISLGGLPNMSRGIKPVSDQEEDLPAGKMVQHLSGEAHRPSKEQLKKLRTRGLLG